MDRRLAGALLLVGVLTCALVVPAALGRTVVGVPVAAPAPGPPVPGDCLASMAGIADSSVVYSQASALQLPTGTIGSCAGPMVGEVVSVDPTGSEPANATINSYVTGAKACATSTIGYLAVPATRTVDGITWKPGLGSGSDQIGPDARQAAAGQQWSACVVTGATSRYSGSLRGAFAHGPLPVALGLCWPGGVSMATELIPCDQPHQSQLLATGVASGAAPGPALAERTVLTASCRQYARTMMAGRAVTAGDPLAIQVVAQGLGPQVLLCSATVTGSNRLTGSLMGIGTRPLPLAN
ncbi:hypothetical protein ABIB25_003995 [Nakamurella sp. UYEF19]|uniref:hypothetical protein n=1 Tax=Nakamurella sp. UYEF19 TaxID=1756392 RepID=UPI0033925CF0